MSRNPRFTLGVILRTIAILLLSVFVLWYVLFQARSFLHGPVIELSREYAVVQSARTLPIEGTARNIVKLTLNGREIYTDTDGTFSEEVVLEDGYTQVTLEALDRFGRRVALTREFVFKPAEQQNTP